MLDQAVLFGQEAIVLGRIAIGEAATPEFGAVVGGSQDHADEQAPQAADVMALIAVLAPVTKVMAAEKTLEYLQTNEDDQGKNGGNANRVGESGYQRKAESKEKGKTRDMVDFCLLQFSCGCG